MSAGQNIEVKSMVRFVAALLAAALFSLPALAQSGAPELTLEHSTSVRIAAWNAAETRILTAEGNGAIHIWSGEDGARLLTFHEGESPVARARWALDDAAILSAAESGRILLSDAGDGETKYGWTLDGLPLALELNSAGTDALAFTRAGAGAILSLENGEMARRFAAPEAIGGANWNADETQVRAWSESGRIYTWDVATGDAFDYVAAAAQPASRA